MSQTFESAHARLPRAERPTMRDVAALAGVGLKTVSRVYNDVPSVDVELVTRVRTAAAKLGYRPNLTASNLRRADRRTATLGLLLEDVANPFSGAVHRAVEDVARPRGYLVLTASLDGDAARERRLAEALVDRRVDALIVVPVSTDQSYLAIEQRAGTPVVFLDREPSLVQADCVVTTNQQGGQDAVGHLAAHGHRRIAYLGDLGRISTARHRLEGYRLGLRAAGIELDPAMVVQDLTTEADACRATLALLDSDEPPTALFAAQNLITMGAVRALRSRSLHRSTALVGFDDFHLADLLEPAVTVISQDPARLGRCAADLVFRRLDGDVSGPAMHLLPTVLVPRGSGEISRHA